MIPPETTDEFEQGSPAPFIALLLLVLFAGGAVDLIAPILDSVLRNMTGT